MIDDVLDETYGDMKRKAENREFENLEAKDLPLGRELMMMVWTLDGKVFGLHSEIILM